MIRYFVTTAKAMIEVIQIQIVVVVFLLGYIADRLNEILKELKNK